MTNKESAEKALACFADPSRRHEYFDLYSDDVILRGYQVVEPGLESVKQYYKSIWEALPDARVDAEEMIEAGNRVIIRFRLRGTHEGTMLGLSPTGNTVDAAGITILRFDDGKCVERWSVMDSLTLFAQLGGLGRTQEAAGS